MQTARGSFSIDRWLGLWGRVGARGSGRKHFRRLRRAHRQPWRFYHDARHVDDCLQQLDAARALAVDADRIEMALWFHDAIYVPWRSLNEERSAELATSTLRRAEIAPAWLTEVEAMILATRHAETPPAGDGALMVDIDLSILGRDPERFDRYQRDVRREYCWVPWGRYRRARGQILSSFLARRRIFITDRFHALYEQPARRNLRRAVNELDS